MEIMAGVDPLDATTVSAEVPVYTKGDLELGALRVGIPKEYFELEGLDPEIRAALEKTMETLKAAGATLVDISLPHTKYAIPTYYIIVPSEDSSNLGRIDSIRYGVQSAHDDLYGAYANSRRDGFPNEVKRRIMIGTYALSAGYYDAYYRKAQKVRTRICQDFDTVFGAQVDVILTPTTPTPAFGVGEKSNDPLAMYLADVFVSPSALAGLPSFSVPVGKTASGLPIGAQLIGPMMGESVVLSVAQHIEVV
jgi:aspartyl-tRNA(Asn)/glutamyl-tRNA(Gln) amidotransferase subunit A